MFELVTDRAAPIAVADGPWRPLPVPEPEAYADDSDALVGPPCPPELPSGASSPPTMTRHAGLVD